MSFRYLLLALLFVTPAAAETRMGDFYAKDKHLQFELRDDANVRRILDNAVCSQTSTGDIRLICDQAAEVEAAHCFDDEGFGYDLLLDAAETKCKELTILIKDRDASLWADKVINVSLRGPTGIATAGDVNSITLQVGSSAIDNAYRAVQLSTLAGTGPDQVVCLCGYNGSTRVATPCRPFPVAVAAGTEYAIDLIPCAINDDSPGDISDAVVVAMFSVDSGTDFSAAIPGSVVFEIASNATVVALAANTLTAAAAAADLTTELQTGLATATALNTVDDFVDTEIANIQSRLPTSLVSGRIDASVGAMATDVVTASALSAGGLDKIAAFNWRQSTADIESASYTGLDSVSCPSGYGMVAQQVHRSQIIDGEWTKYRSDNTTQLCTVEIQTDSGAAPITGVGTNP